MLRATLKGHGNPTQIMYFGMGAEPIKEGILVTVKPLGRKGCDLITVDGESVEGPRWHFAPATKFWGRPAEN